MTFPKHGFKWIEIRSQDVPSKHIITPFQIGSRLAKYTEGNNLMQLLQTYLPSTHSYENWPIERKGFRNIRTFAQYLFLISSWGEKY